MQNYFMRPFAKELRDGLVGNVSRLREACVRAGVPVAYSAQPGGMTGHERGLLRDFWGAGMSASPEDQGIIAELAPEAGDWMITKWRYSAFFNNDFLGRIRAAGRDQILVCGVYAQLGILITAVESYSHDVETFLVADAVADFREDRHRHALDYAAGSCAVVVTVEEAVRWLTL